MAKNKQNIDPHYQREATNYENPIPSREFILSCLEGSKKPVGLDKLAKKLKITDSKSVEALSFRLSAMVRDCQILLKSGGYLPASYIESAEGILCFDMSGQVILLPDDGGSLIYLYPNEVQGLYEGDKIVVNINRYDDAGHPHGSLVELLEAIEPKVVGKLNNETIPPMVLPLDQRFSPVVLQQGAKHAKNGMLVVASIDRSNPDADKLHGEIVKVLGDTNQPGVFTEVAINAYDIPNEWPQTVEKHASHIEDILPEHEHEGRVDFRDLPLVTIDGEDARDFDDAVYCTPHKDGYRLIVAIADVSHYVKPHAPLDKEAQKRGNSVYFPDKVIPMLPESLSNGICSLKPKVDRLCLAADLLINASGKITKIAFCEAVMHSHARFTYNDVSGVLGGNQHLRKVYKDFIEPLDHLENLYNILNDARQQRGAIAFETVEAQIIFDAEHRVEKIMPRHRTLAHKIIEECMLAANIAAAKYLIKHRHPALFRIHDGPTSDKLTDLRLLLSEYQLDLKGGSTPKPADYNELLKKIVTLPNCDRLQTALLRSLTQAVYSPDNIGHFGLAYEQYLHFTSPIRRYPDLITHRAIKACIAKQSFSRVEKKDQHGDLLQVGEHCSHTERRADEATRNVVQSYKCQYLEDRVGDIFLGTVMHVANFGLFVNLKDAYVEGLLHVRQLGREYFKFDEIQHRMVGEASGTIYQIGDVLSVQLVAVDALAGKLDLNLVNEDGSTPDELSAKPSKGKKRRKQNKQQKSRRRKRS